MSASDVRRKHSRPKTVACEIAEWGGLAPAPKSSRIYKTAAR
jgi:hypothetical protein